MTDFNREVVSVPVRDFADLPVGAFFVLIGPNKISHGELCVKIKGDKGNAMRRVEGNPFVDMEPGIKVIELK